LVDKPAEEDKKKRSQKQKAGKLDLSSISAEEAPEAEKKEEK